MNLRFIAFTACISLGSMLASGQTADRKSNPDTYPELLPMSSYDSLMLSQLPPLQLSPTSLKRNLPYKVDNSALSFFRPLIAQVGLECGQAASIGNALTYELNVLRNAPGDQPQNQMATHFTYNFLNNGSNAGISYYETFEIVKRAGNPSVADYGGMAQGGASRWMNGYDLYYNSMHNRINDIYSIKTNTLEGLETLKQWIFDHGNGSEYGGVACFYSEFNHPPVLLPPGTEEGGSHVIIHWGSSPNHAMTIVGYNDSIRYDYNGDNQYTNNIDLNGDGLITVSDWEIGGFKMANTYGSISGWGDEGFSYMMYKTVADNNQQGGIWNNVVVVADARENHEPLLTARVILTHPCRNSLKVSIGLSTDANDTEPEYILRFPIFDFQGGCNPMEGTGMSETLEFGLDLNPLLTYITPGESAKLFLMVNEYDPNNSYSGMINHFSVIDYTSGQTETVANGSAGILNNTLTMMNVVSSFDHEPVNIQTESLPPVQLYQDYDFDLQASEGTEPYRWSFAYDYLQFDSTATQPEFETEVLIPSNNNSGMAKVTLPFAFPFYGESFNEVYVTVDGYIRFDETLIPWPYYIDGKSYFLQNKMIAPLMSNTFVVTSSEGDGIWFETGEGYCSFRWKLSVSGQTNTSETNFVARLYEDGRIAFYYGYQNVPFYVRRYGGLSSGDGENYVLMNTNSTFSPVQLRYNRFSPVNEPVDLDITADGKLYGFIDELLDNSPIKVCVTDNNNLKHFKTFLLSTEGVVMEAEVSGVSQNAIVYGEPFTLDLDFTNINSFPLSSSTVSISINDYFFEVVEAVSDFPAIAVGENKLLQDVFQINTDRFVPHGHKVVINLSMAAPEGNWSRSLELVANAPLVQMASMLLDDGNNGMLEPGETALLYMNLANNGGAAVTTAMAVLTTDEPALQISNPSLSLEVFEAGESWQLVYEVYLDEDAIVPPVIGLNLHVIGDKEYSCYKSYPLITAFVIEDFESAGMEQFDWVSSGHAPWYVDNQVPPYEGSYAARSGVIIDNQTSTLALEYNVAFPDTLSFYYKVSSEPNYDYLRFFINEVEYDAWAGNVDWTQYKTFVNAGNQIFVWKYIKDYSVSTGDDCARIDFILFPPYAIPTGSAEISKPISDLTVYPNPSINDMVIRLRLNESSQCSITIMDASGKMVWHEALPGTLQPGEHKFYPPFGRLGQGIYFVIATTDTETIVRKIVRTN